MIPNNSQNEIERFLRQLQNMVYKAYLSMLNVAGVKNAIKNGNDSFFFANNDTANKAVNKIIAQMAKQMDGTLLNGIERSWKQGEDNFLDKIKLTFSQTARDKKAFDLVREQATNSARDKTAQSFYNEKRDGLNISERVWNLAKNSKKEVELIVQKGIKEGKSAAEIQKSLKGYLNEPDKLFHRVKVTVKDKDGNIISEKLELSKAAQEYHPGRGVYRSAYKNAMRLARTEIAAAYNQAQWEMFQNDPSITGFRIVLSNNHTCINPTTGKPEPFHDMCDELQGEYPKTFKWTLWHPQCRCTMIPISITREERKDYYKAFFDGKESEWTPKNVITEVPDNFKKWVIDNTNRIEQAEKRGTLPYFLKNNYKTVTYSRQNIKDITGQSFSLADVKDLQDSVNKFTNEFNHIHGYSPMVNIKTNVSLSYLKNNLEAIIQLSKEYRLSIPITEINIRNIHDFGQVKDVIILGKHTKTLTLNGKNQSREDMMKRLYSMSDDNRLKYANITHEYGHLIFTPNGRTSKYWKIEETFIAEREKIWKNYQTQYDKTKFSNLKSQKWYIGKYGSGNIEDFMAECFQEYRNSSNPSKYASLIGNLIDKYFKITD
jgi:hypothetical protein